MPNSSGTPIPPGPYSWRSGGRSAGRGVVSPFYDQVQAHIALMEKNRFHETAAMLRLYESERERQATAIKNLEDQLANLVNQSLNQAELREILARAGMDLDVLIESDKVFGEKKPEVGVHVMTYCKHGQDVNGACGQCGRRVNTGAPVMTPTTQKKFKNGGLIYP